MPDTLTYPARGQTDYLGVLRFTPESLPGSTDGEQIELFLPTNISIADGVTLENVDMGLLAEAGINLADKAQDGGMSSITDLMSAAGTANAMEKIAGLKINEIVSALMPAAGAAVREVTRQAPNPNSRALFKQVNLRTFSFTFKLIPTSAEEARVIGRIITSFRTQMYPETIQALGVAAGYKFPARYQIEAFYDGKEMNNYHMRTEQCYLQSITTNYNPSNQAIMKSPGRGSEPYFSEIDISLMFSEAKTLNRRSVEFEGY